MLKFWIFTFAISENRKDMVYIKDYEINCKNRFFYVALI